MNFNQVENCLMIRTSRKWLHKIERERQTCNDDHDSRIGIVSPIEFQGWNENFASHLEK